MTTNGLRLTHATIDEAAQLELEFWEEACRMARISHWTALELPISKAESSEPLPRATLQPASLENDASKEVDG
jgi:hypothetical protein